MNGYIYLGWDKNRASLAEWHRQAQWGDAEAQYQVGVRYLLGDGVPIDREKAASWWLKSAEQGYIEAQLQIGECFIDGSGVSQDVAEGINWYHKAAKLGSENAMY